jgi:hypothetical protein
LRDAVEWTNFPLKPEFHVKVRAAFDYGVVRRSDNGYVGRAIVGVARLVDSEPLRAALKEGHEACAVMVSDTLYQDAVVDDLEGFPAEHFAQAAVLEKEYRACAWLYTPPTSETGYTDDQLG